MLMVGFFLLLLLLLPPLELLGGLASAVPVLSLGAPPWARHPGGQVRDSAGTLEKGVMPSWIGEVGVESLKVVWISRMGVFFSSSLEVDV